MSIFLNACSKIEQYDQSENAVIDETPEVVVEENLREKGSINMEYSSDISTTSKEGEYVLAPSLGMFEPFVKDPSSENVIFYTQTMKTPQSKESVLTSTFDGDYDMPNSLIVPIPAGQVAEKGDVVLTWWQSGSGMILAKVLEGGETPFVTYLEPDFEIEDANLKANSFVKLTGDFMPGAPVIVKDGEDFKYEVMISNSNGDILTQGFAGFIYVREKSNTTVINPYQTYEVGEEIYVPVINSYDPGVIVSYDEERGSMEVEYSWAGSKETKIFKTNEVTKSLD